MKKIMELISDHPEAAVLTGVFIAVIAALFLAVEHDTNACATRGGRLIMKSTSSGATIEFCIAPDGRILE